MFKKILLIAALLGISSSAFALEVTGDISLSSFSDIGVSNLLITGDVAELMYDNLEADQVIGESFRAKSGQNFICTYNFHVKNAYACSSLLVDATGTLEADGIAGPYPGVGGSN
jgi:hypothetical protein